MATPGTPSGENHSAESQKCGVEGREGSCLELALELGDARLERAPLDVTPSSQIRRSSSRSSGQADHSSTGTTAVDGTDEGCLPGASRSGPSSDTAGVWRSNHSV